MDSIIRGGTNINPYEIDSMLRTQPAVMDVCVVGRPDPELGEVPGAFIVGDLTQEGLDRFLTERGLARYKGPERIHRLDEPPPSGPGRVNRTVLRQLAARTYAQQHATVRGAP